jgi:hypothetical protein
VEDREDPVPVTVVGIKADEVSHMSLCPLLDISQSYPEVPVLFLISIYRTNYSSLGNR